MLKRESIDNMVKFRFKSRATCVLIVIFLTAFTVFVGDVIHQFTEISKEIYWSTSGDNGTFFETSEQIEENSTLSECGFGFSFLANGLVSLMRSNVESEVKELSVPPSKSQVLILAYHRTGSTFLGAVLSSYPSSFYNYEPLMGTDTEDANRLGHASLSRLISLFECDYRHLDDYLQMKNREKVFWFRENLQFWTACNTCRNKCDEACAMHRINIMKVVRLRLRDAQKLLDRFPSLRVVHLVRDPRAIYNSRRNLSWCQSNRKCSSVEQLCRSMKDDLDFSATFRKKYPGRYILVQHEDLSRDPFKQTERILRFLELEPSDKITGFLESHTSGGYIESGWNPYSTSRKSTDVPLGWIKKLNWDQVKMVQESCSDVIRTLGFEILYNEEHLLMKRKEY